MASEAQKVYRQILAIGNLVGRALPVAEFHHQRLQVATGLSPCHDSEGCIIPLQLLNGLQRLFNRLSCCAAAGRHGPDLFFDDVKHSSHRIWKKELDLPHCAGEEHQMKKE